MEVVSPSQAPENDVRPSHALNSRQSTVDHYRPSACDELNATQVLGVSQGPRPSLMASVVRPSLMASVVRPSSMVRPSVVTDLSNNFSEAKIHDAHVQVFSSDVLMEGELTKKGEGGLQTWKNVSVRIPHTSMYREGVWCSNFVGVGGIRSVFSCCEGRSCRTTPSTASSGTGRSRARGTLPARRWSVWTTCRSP